MNMYIYIVYIYTYSRTEARQGNVANCSDLKSIYFGLLRLEHAEHLLVLLRQDSHMLILMQCCNCTGVLGFGLRVSLGGILFCLGQ